MAARPCRPAKLVLRITTLPLGEVHNRERKAGALPLKAVRVKVAQVEAVQFGSRRQGLHHATTVQMPFSTR